MEEKSFAHYPIPLWVKAFAGGIGLIVLFSLFSFPRNIAMALHLERGKDAIQSRKYLTAQKEFSEVLKGSPGNLEAQGNQLIAAFYNQDDEILATGIQSLKGTKIDDEELYKQLDEIRFDTYFPSDSFVNFRTVYTGVPRIPDTAWHRYLLQNPDDLYARMIYSGTLFDEKAYAFCDTTAEEMLKKDPSYLPGLMMMASLKREQGQCDASLGYCHRMLMINNESVYALASEVRTLLKQKKDGEALKLALRTYGMDEKNDYSIASLIMAYHFNGRTRDRDELIRKANTVLHDTLTNPSLQYALDVISTKERFRD